MNLKEELYACFKYIGIPFDVLDKMPIRDRKLYIIKHNEFSEREKERMDHMLNNKNTTEAIDRYTDMEQAAIGRSNGE